ncbi:tRNA isopentenyl-2-thiomethyl-A-37 hydroxylase MiaE, partial [Vibrio alfacsensis]
MITSSQIDAILSPINQFLQCSTPNEWVEEAKKPDNLPTI